MNRKQLLLDSVKKLLALNVSDREIILNLKDVGISAEQAQALLDEARGKAPAKDYFQEFEKISDMEEAEEPDGESEAEEPGEEQSDALEESAEEEEEPEQEEELQEPEQSKIVSRSVERRQKRDQERLTARAAEKASVSSIPTGSSAEMDKLWQKGIISAVNQSLHEMKQIRSDLDKVISEKISVETEKELKKLKTLQESQQTLMIHKMDAALEKKVGEVTEQIDAKIKELAKSSREVQSQIEKLESKRQMEKTLVGQLSQKIAELEKTKEANVSEFNSEIGKARSAVQEMLDDAAKKIGEIDARANKTLELESNVVEGLLKDAQVKIEQLALVKSKSLDNALKKELEYLEGVRAQVKPEEIKAKLSEFQEAEAQIEKVQKAQIAREAEMQKKIEAKLSEVSAAEEEVKEIQKKQFEEQKAREAEMQKTMSERLEEYVKYLQNQTTNLETFKQQFINIIDANVEKFNKAVQKINETLGQFEQQQNARIKLIDSKIQELDEFEKKFAEEMEINIMEFEKKPKKKKKNKEAEE